MSKNDGWALIGAWAAIRTNTVGTNMHHLTDVMCFNVVFLQCFSDDAVERVTHMLTRRETPADLFEVIFLLKFKD